MGKLHDKFQRQPGELIRANDWNNLLLGIEGLIDGLSEKMTVRFEQLDSKFTALEQKVETVINFMEDNQPVLDTLRARFYRVDMHTTSSRFAIGQRGVITARVTDITGAPLENLSDPANRPWVDFVTVWGTLKAESGFTSRGGAGDKTISVRVNSDGIARVLIRSDHAESFAEEQEQEVASFLDTRPIRNNSRSIAHLILEAATPQDEVMQSSFKAINKAYDQSSTNTPVVRDYLDAYYMKEPARVSGAFAPGFINHWRDYRATVMAFVKPDSDPLSADGTLATASIQVTFRDWIGPWLNIGYLPDRVTLIPGLTTKFGNMVDVDLGLSVNNIIKEVSQNSSELGILGKQRHLISVDEAISNVSFETNQPPFMADLTSAIKTGAQMQSTMLYAQSVSPGASKQAVSFSAMASSNSKSASDSMRVQEELTRTVDEKMQETRKAVKDDVKVDQAAFESALMAEDGPIRNVQHKLLEFDSQVASLSSSLGKKADVDMINGVLRATGNFNG